MLDFDQHGTDWLCTFGSNLHQLLFPCKQAALQAVKEEEDLPPPLPVEAPPRPPTATPVSKWTLVDYDEDNPPNDLEGYAAL